jgi:NADH-quinone oxidoreductase subunit M
MLYALVSAPFVAAILACLASGRDGAAAARVGIVLAMVVAALAVPLVTCMPDLAVDHAWFALWGTSATIHFSLASDGLSAWLVQLVTVLTPLAMLASREHCGDRMREFVVATLAMEGLMILALLARDLVLFYVGFEAMLVPMVVLMALFGSADRRGAALQFFLYTMFGSVFLLVAIWYLAWRVGSTDMAALVDLIPVALSPEQQLGLFIGFALAFAVKVPLFPFHGWQARAYAESPTGAAMLLAGAMAKLGVYGFLRLVLPFFPALSAQYAPVFIALGLISVVGGALIALAQTDVKRMLAYSSLSHLGLVMVGIFSFSATAVAGATVQMVAHGISVAALFLLVGGMERRFTKRGLDDFGGLAERAPVFAVCLVTAALASAALPGTGNFAGEFALLFGMFRALPGWMTAVAGLSTILTVVYLLRLAQRWLYGPAKGQRHPVEDLTIGELAAVIPLIVLSFVLGFYSSPIAGAAGPVAERLSASARAEAHALDAAGREDPHAVR